MIFSFDRGPIGGILLTPFTFCLEGAHIAAQRQRWLFRRLFLLTSLVGLSFRLLPGSAQLPPPGKRP